MERIIGLVGMGAGFGISALLLILAAVAANASLGWADAGRDGAAVGYAAVTFFLVVAGGGGAAATYNHFFRVLDPTRAPPPAHH